MKKNVISKIIRMATAATALLFSACASAPPSAAPLPAEPPPASEPQLVSRQPASESPPVQQAQQTPASGLLSLDDALTRTAADISSRVRERTEIAIVSLDAPSRDVSEFLRDELASHLVSGGRFIMLERGAALDAVTAEHDFQMSGFVDDEAVVGIGHYLGAKVVLTGSFNLYGGFSQLRVRAIDVRSSQLLTLYTARIRADDEVLAGVLRLAENVPAPVVAENALDYLNRGEDLLREKRYDEAIREFDRGLAISRDIASGYFFRSFAHYHKGNVDHAIADLNEVIRLNPNHTMAYINRGVMYHRKGERDRAIMDLSEAIRLNPNNSQVFFYRGILYRDKGDLDRAVADFTQAIRLNPNNAEAYFDRGGIYLTRGDLARAVEDFNQAIRLQPNNAEMYFRRGLANGHLGNADRAIEDFTQAIRLKPNDAEMYFNRGALHYNNGDNDKAIADWEEALRHNPNHANARQYLEIARQQ